jgi:hypothetical protein
VNQAGDLIHRLAQALPQLEASERHERAEQRPDREALSLGPFGLTSSGAVFCALARKRAASSIGARLAGVLCAFDSGTLAN